jgi:hypothetical protein
MRSANCWVILEKAEQPAQQRDYVHAERDHRVADLLSHAGRQIEGSDAPAIALCQHIVLFPL